MSPSSIPTTFDCSQFVQLLTEPTSLALLAQIQRLQIQVEPSSTLTDPLHPITIETSYVQQGEVTPLPPILLLHGFDSSLLEFRRLLPLLSPHRQVWAIDLLGFGFTERPAGIDYSPTSIQQHLWACWQTLINQPVILVGASMGGAAAIQFALSFPQAVEQLVLIDTAGYTDGPKAGKWLIPPLGYLATEFLRQPRVRQAISQKAYYDPIWASEDARNCAALHLLQPRWREALIAFTQSGGYPSLKAQLPDLTCPTTLIWGDCDRILGTKVAVAIAAAIPNSCLNWIPQCGHVPHLEQPQATAAAILQ